MTKQEFLDALGSRLSEELDANETASQLRYYEGYLDGEIARGHSEEEAVGALGDPYLIAKTIIETPHEEGLLGRSVPDETSSYYEGAFQAENETLSYGYHEDNTSHGAREESASYGEREENTSYGTREESASYGAREESTSYGTREENTSYGAREENTSYGTKEENASYGSREENMSYGTKEQDSFEDGPRHAAFEENVTGTVDRSNKGFLRDENGDFNWGAFAMILAAVMILVAVIYLVTRVVVAFAPIILIIAAITLISRTLRRR